MRTLVKLMFVSAIAAAASSVGAAPAALDVDTILIVARNGADDPAGNLRRGRGADNPPADIRGGRGAGNPPTDIRHGRGRDNPPGDNRRGRGADDPPLHG